MPTERGAFVTEYPGEELEATALAVNYRRWILRALLPYLRGSVAEVGAGHGTFSRELIAAPIERLLALEPSANLFPILQRALAGERRATLRASTLPRIAHELHEQFNAVVYINVLEHIEHDRAELDQAVRVLAPGGVLCLFVPALPWLFASFDASIGHFRRYRRNELIRLVEDVGLEVETARYFDALGVLSWLVAFKWLRLPMSRGSMRFYDTLAVPVARVLDRMIGPPIGKSLLLVARKPGGG